MLQAIMFEVMSRDNTAVVQEKGGRYVAEFFKVQNRAEIYAAYLNAEHVHGRVAQGSCKLGVACDRERMFARPAQIASHVRERIVLCGEHSKEWDQAHR